jgi:cell division protein FtsB
MNNRQRLIVSISGIVWVALMFFIVFSEGGLADLNWLRNEKRLLVQQNTALENENRTLSLEIDRLKKDPAYIEQIARHKLGMIGRDELIIKSKSATQRQP